MVPKGGMNMTASISDSEYDRMYFLCYKLSDTHEEARILFEETDYTEVYRKIMLRLAANYVPEKK